MLDPGKSAVYEGDCLELIPELPPESVDVVVTSPPYWGQRVSLGGGVEADPRDYLAFLESVFVAILPKLKRIGILWLNMGDCYNTPVNWTMETSYRYTTLANPMDNSAYTKPRHRRKAFLKRGVPWLRYGNLMMLPHRLVTRLVDAGYIYRGEIIWRKRNPMPEGRCRRPHRQHEPIFLLARDEKHSFRVAPPVPSVWEFANENIGMKHEARFPLALPRECISAYGQDGDGVVVLDPFSGSGTTGKAALELGCAYVGFEIDPGHVASSRRWLGLA